jgi:hypothetical protein
LTLLNLPPETDAGAAVAELTGTLELADRWAAIHDGTVAAVSPLGMGGKTGGEEDGKNGQQVTRAHVSVSTRLLHLINSRQADNIPGDEEQS